MGMVGVRIEAVGIPVLQVLLVGLHRVLVRLDRVLVAADPQVDVRGHVDHVARGRHQLGQPLRGDRQPTPPEPLGFGPSRDP